MRLPALSPAGREVTIALSLGGMIAGAWTSNPDWGPLVTMACGVGALWRQTRWWERPAPQETAPTLTAVVEATNAERDRLWREALQRLPETRYRARLHTHPRATFTAVDEAKAYTVVDTVEIGTFNGERWYSNPGQDRASRRPALCMRPDNPAACKCGGWCPDDD